MEWFGGTTYPNMFMPAGNPDNGWIPTSTGAGHFQTEEDVKNKQYHENTWTGVNADATSYGAGDGSDPRATATIHWNLTTADAVSVSYTPSYSVSILASGVETTLDGIISGNFTIRLDRPSEISFSVLSSNANADLLTPPNEILLRDSWGFIIERFALDIPALDRSPEPRIVANGYSLLSQLESETVGYYGTGGEALSVNTILAGLLAEQEKSNAIGIGDIDGQIGAYKLVVALEGISILQALRHIQSLLSMDLAGHFYVNYNRKLCWQIEFGAYGPASNILSVDSTVAGYYREENRRDVRNRIYLRGQDENGQLVKLSDRDDMSVDYVENATSQATYDVCSMTHTIRTIRHLDTLLAAANRILQERKDPKVLTRIAALDALASDSYGRLDDISDIRLGAKYTLTDDDESIADESTVVEINCPDIHDRVRLNLLFSNKYSNILEQLDGMNQELAAQRVSDQFARIYTAGDDEPLNGYRTGDLRTREGRVQHRDGAGWIDHADQRTGVDKDQIGDNGLGITNDGTAFLDGSRIVPIYEFEVEAHMNADIDWRPFEPDYVATEMSFPIGILNTLTVTHTDAGGSEASETLTLDSEDFADRSYIVVEYDGDYYKLQYSTEQEKVMVVIMTSGQSAQSVGDFSVSGVTTGDTAEDSNTGIWYVANEYEDYDHGSFGFVRQEDIWYQRNEQNTGWEQLASGGILEAEDLTALNALTDVDSNNLGRTTDNGLLYKRNVDNDAWLLIAQTVRAAANESALDSLSDIQATHLGRATDTGALYRRNAANDAWLKIGMNADIEQNASDILDNASDISTNAGDIDDLEARRSGVFTVTSSTGSSPYTLQEVSNASNEITIASATILSGEQYLVNGSKYLCQLGLDSNWYVLTDLDYEIEQAVDPFRQNGIFTVTSSTGSSPYTLQEISNTSNEITITTSRILFGEQYLVNGSKYFCHRGKDGYWYAGTDPDYELAQAILGFRESGMFASDSNDGSDPVNLTETNGTRTISNLPMTRVKGGDYIEKDKDYFCVKDGAGNWWIINQDAGD